MQQNWKIGDRVRSPTDKLHEVTDIKSNGVELTSEGECIKTHPQEVFENNGFHKEKVDVCRGPKVSKC
jgi:hypothetical protein